MGAGHRGTRKQKQLYHSHLRTIQLFRYPRQGSNKRDSTREKPNSMESPGSEPGTISADAMQEALLLHDLLAKLMEDQRALVLGLAQRAAGLTE